MPCAPRFCAVMLWIKSLGGAFGSRQNVCSIAGLSNFAGLGRLFRLCPRPSGRVGLSRFPLAITPKAWQWRAAMHGARAVIIMPEDAPLVKIAGTRALGASVVLYKRESEDREAVANTHNPDGSMCLIKPFDDVNVIAGQASVGAELAEQAVAAGIIGADVFVPCGGAGLSSGIGLAMEQAGGFGRLHPCEPVGFDDVKRSLASGVIESNTRLGGSVCDAIITPSPGQITFPILRRLQEGGDLWRWGGGK